MATELTSHERLLADTRWLQPLLERLVGDRHAAEDLRQEALLAAWARHPEGAVPRSWLSRVARNLAASFWRRTALQDGVEGAAASDRDAAAPPELIAEAELQGRAVEAVLALREPYRTTVLLRYMKGRSVVEVATEMGVPEETVRTRQRRALVVLRRKLGGCDRRLGWLPAGWFGWAKTTAVIAMSKKGVAAMVSMLALLAFGWMVAPWTANVPPALPAARVEADASIAAASGQESADSGESSRAATARSAVAAAETGELEVLLTWEGAREPAVDIPLRLSPRNGEPGAMLVSDGAGRLRFLDLAPGDYWLKGMRPNLNERIDVRAGQLVRREYTLDEGLTGNVTVVDAFGEPVPGALVVGAQGGTHPAWTYPLGRTDERGRYAFRGMHSLHLLGAVSETMGTSPFLLLATEVEASRTTRAVTLTVPGRAGSVFGRVFEAGGAPVENAVVVVYHGYGRLAASDDRSWWRPSPMATHTDATGRFALTALHPEDADLVVLAQGWAPFSRRIRLRSGPVGEQTVVLDSGGTVEGAITDELGQPIPGARLNVETACDFSHYGPTVGEDGSFRMERVPAGRCRIEVVSIHHAPWEEELAIAVGGRHRVRAVLAGGAQQRCRLVDAAGAPLAKWMFDARPRFWGRTDDDGFFTLQLQEGRRETLSVRDGKRPFDAIVHTFGPLEARSGVITLTVPAERMPSAWLTGRLLGSDGAPLSDISLQIEQRRRGARRGFVSFDGAETDADGAFRLGPLPPGEYGLIPQHASLAFPPCEAAASADEEFDFGALRGVAGASLTVIPASETAELVLLDEQSRVCRPRPGTGSRVVFALLWPGTYRLAEGDGHRVLRELMLAAGEDRELRLTR